MLAIIFKSNVDNIERGNKTKALTAIKSIILYQISSDLSLSFLVISQQEKMIDAEKLVLKKEVASNPLIRIHLIAMKMFGYILFDDQKRKKLHYFRGIVFSISFILFNVTQVFIKNLLNAKTFDLNLHCVFLLSPTLSLLIYF